MIPKACNNGVVRVVTAPTAGVVLDYGIGKGLAIREARSLQAIDGFVIAVTAVSAVARQG